MVWIILASTKESNGNNTWWGWNVEFDRFLDKPEDADTRSMTEDFWKFSSTSDIFGKVQFEGKDDKTIDQIPTAKIESSKDDISQFKS